MLPVNIFTTINVFRPELYDAYADIVTTALFNMQPIFDPILYTIAMKDFRDVIKDMFKFKHN